MILTLFYIVKVNVKSVQYNLQLSCNENWGERGEKLELDIKKNMERKDLLTGKKYVIEYELYQSYERFNVYCVYKRYLDSDDRIFLYKETKRRCDFGKRKLTKKESLAYLKRLEELHDSRRDKQ